MPKPRAYYPIWKKLKADGVVSITANKLLHSRIIKAVAKEKWMDVGYKLENDPNFVVLSHTTSYSVLTFKLTIKTGDGNQDLRKFDKMSGVKLKLFLQTLLATKKDS